MCDTSDDVGPEILAHTNMCHMADLHKITLDYALLHTEWVNLSQ